MPPKIPPPPKASASYEAAAPAPVPIKSLFGGPLGSVPQGLRKATAENLRRLFVAAKSNLRGTIYALETKNKDINLWMKVADICLSCQADPAEFIQACFDGFPGKEGPYPSQMTSESTRSMWKNYAAARSAENSDVNDFRAPAEYEVEMSIKLTVDFLNKRCGTCNPTDARVIFLLRASCTDIPAYIRCALCAGDIQVMSEYAPAAQEFLAKRPAIVAAMIKSELPVREILSWK